MTASFPSALLNRETLFLVYSTGTKALDNVSLDINKGEFVFIVGPSGAGKSTFLKLIMREEATTEGEISVNGYNLVKIKKRKIPYLRRTMGIVFQDFRLIEKISVLKGFHNERNTL